MLPAGVLDFKPPLWQMSKRGFWVSQWHYF